MWMCIGIVCVCVAHMNCAVDGRDAGSAVSPAWEQCTATGHVSNTLLSSSPPPRPDTLAVVVHAIGGDGDCAEAVRVPLDLRAGPCLSGWWPAAASPRPLRVRPTNESHVLVLRHNGLLMFALHRAQREDGQGGPRPLGTFNGGHQRPAFQKRIQTTCLLHVHDAYKAI